MKTLSQVKSSLSLLREARAGLHNESHDSLALKIDEAIVCLEVIEREGAIDAEMIQQALVVLGKGFAAIPSIIHLVEIVRNS